MIFEVADAGIIFWDRDVFYFTSRDYALLYDTFAITFTAGNSYDISSRSFFDPFILTLYGADGAPLAYDADFSNTIRPYGTDGIDDFVSTYSGTYYISASWDQGTAQVNKSVSLAVFEDVPGVIVRNPAQIVGTGGPDFLIDTAVGENLLGGAGNDILFGAGGNDTLNGDLGLDTAFFTGGYRSSVVTVLGGLPATVRTGEGTDTLISVEVLDFADGRLVFNADDPIAQALRLYRAALGREPDQAGLNYQADLIQRGVALSDVAAGFSNSPEFRARYGSLGDDALVTQLYHNVLKREPSAADLGFYRGQLRSGFDRDDILANFSESPENKALTNGAVANGVWDRSENGASVARLYDTVLGRAPDASGLRYYRDQLDRSTNTLLGIVRDFTDSPEFQARYGNTSNAAFVDVLYHNTLDRSAGVVESNYYVTRLDTGTLTRPQVVLGFSESPEHINLMAASIGSDNTQ